MNLRTLKKKIKQYNTIIIHRHSNPDGDALGSQFGLKQLIIDNFKNKNVITVGNEELPSRMKVLFPLNNTIVNKSVYENALVIVTDTANKGRISGKNYILGKEIIKIDHHPNIEIYTENFIVDENISSSCELISKIAINLRWKISKEAATFLYIGIVTDTGRFLYPSVTSQTYTILSKLQRTGLEHTKILNILLNKNINELKFNSFVLSKVKLTDNIATVIIPKNIHLKYNINELYVSSQVGLLMGISGVKYAIYASHDNNKSNWRVSLRSKEKPINNIASMFGGGGHKMASGVRVKDKNVIKQIYEAVKRL